MSELPAEISVAEQAQASGQRIRPIGQNDEVDQLATHCHAVIASMGGDPKGKGISLAKTKLSEMIYWLRVHKETLQRAG